MVPQGGSAVTVFVTIVTVVRSYERNSVRDIAANGVV